MFKRIHLIFCAVFMVVALQAQDERITKKIDQINTEIRSTDENLALTNDQKTKINAICTDHFAKLDATKNLPKEERIEKSKEIHKSMAAAIANEVLTKEQKKARAASRNKNKN